jgi:hypothetical protein
LGPYDTSANPAAPAKATKYKITPNSENSTEIGQFSPIGLGDTLELILLFNGVGVGRALGGVDELISEALCDGFDVAESRLAGLVREFSII